jgi:hypothetical protein
MPQDASHQRYRLSIDLDSLAALLGPNRRELCAKSGRTQTTDYLRQLWNGLSLLDLESDPAAYLSRQAAAIEQWPSLIERAEAGEFEGETEPTLTDANTTTPLTTDAQPNGCRIPIGDAPLGHGFSRIANGGNACEKVQALGMQPGNRPSRVSGAELVGPNRRYPFEHADRPGSRLGLP